MKFYNKLEILGKVTSFSGIREGAKTDYCFGTLNTFQKEGTGYSISIAFITFDKLAQEMSDLEEESIVKLIGYLKNNTFKEKRYLQLVVTEFEVLSEETEVVERPRKEDLAIPDDDYPF